MKLKFGFFLLSLFLAPPSKSLISSTKEKVNIMRLRVAFPSKDNVDKYDPTAIHLAHQYIFLENIYSPLIEYSSKGEIVSGVAAKFEWVGNEAHLTIRDNLKTVLGNPITASDAEFSIKRLLVLSGNTHGKIKDILCKNFEIKNVHDQCPGIKVIGNKLILIPNEKKHFLFTMLTSIDFAVIPKNSVDLNTLKIIDYKNTSGPYFVEGHETDGTIKLKANKFHYHYSQKIPQEIILSPMGRENLPDSTSSLRKEEIDFITTIDRSREENIFHLISSKEFNVFKTANIKLYGVSFTQNGIKKFNKDERMAIGQIIKNDFWEIFKSSGIFEKTEQFFSPLGEAGLNREEIYQIEGMIKNAHPYRGEKTVNIGVLRFPPSQIENLSGRLKKSIKKYSISFLEKSPNFESEDASSIDLYIFRTDTGFLEDISLISYSISSGKFGFTKKEGEKWIEQYMSIADKGERLGFLRRLHFEILSEAYVVPMFVSPYTAISTKDWKINLSPFYANNQFWLIEKNEY